MRDPNVCPHCHNVITPSETSSVISKDSDDVTCEITAWSCPNGKCSKVFLAIYKLHGSNFEFDRYLNGLPKGPSWPSPIENLLDGKTIDLNPPEKSKFIKTYLQSLVAENNGLDEIAGMGYRKSIEYLVKD